MSRFRLKLTLSILLLTTSTAFAQPRQELADSSLSEVGESDSAGAERETDSTIVYNAQFFAPYKPVTANDMLERWIDC